MNKLLSDEEISKIKRLSNALLDYEDKYYLNELYMKLIDIVRMNPNIFYKFEAEAWKAKQEGFKTYSAKAIVERLRYHTDATAPDRGYKITNSFTTPLSWLLEIYDPRFEEFFKHTKRKGQQVLKVACPCCGEMKCTRAGVGI